MSPGAPTTDFDNIETTFEVDNISGLDHFTSDPFEGSPHSANEEQLLEDGNNEVLNNFEASKKSQEYSRSQTSKHVKSPGIAMSYVDWSGFPGAAHSGAHSPPQTKNKSDRKQRQTRRSSLHNMSNLERRAILRSQTKSSCNDTNLGGSKEQSVPSQPASAKLETQTQRSRSRRHIRLGSNVEDSTPSSTTRPGSRGRARRAERRPSTDRSEKRLSATRVERGASAGRSERRPSSGQRPQKRNPGSIRIARGNKMDTAKSKSLSPRRLRRQVAAAASSTTLNIRREEMPKTSFGSKRSKNFRQIPFADGLLGGANVDNVLINKTQSFKW